MAAKRAAFEKYGAKFLVNGRRDQGENLRGTRRPDASWSFEFDSYQTRIDCIPTRRNTRRRWNCGCNIRRHISPS